MSNDVLLLEKSDGVATITLNRPEAMNALSRQLSDALSSAFREIQEDSEVRVAVVTGNGKAFCAGMDLKELGTGGDESRGTKIGNPTAEAMQDFEGPIIAAVNGFAITAGFELALASDVIIASTKAHFVDSHVRVGILPGWGLGVRLPRLIGVGRAKSVSLTGNPIDAVTAERWGLVSQLVEPEELLPTAHALAQDMASCDPEMLFSYKKLINDCMGMPMAEAPPFETATSTAGALQVTASQIEKRRAAVQERNRDRS